MGLPSASWQLHIHSPSGLQVVLGSSQSVYAWRLPEQQTSAVVT